MSELTVVVLERQPVELYRILKFEGLAASGGEAKHRIDEGQVQVNGETEFRKRRKIVAGDKISYDGHQLLMVVE